MNEVSRIGMDTSKQIFQLHGVDAQERVVVRRRLRRKEVLGYSGSLAPTVVGIEACGARSTPSMRSRPRPGASATRARCWSMSTRRPNASSRMSCPCSSPVCAAAWFEGLSTFRGPSPLMGRA